MSELASEINHPRSAAVQARRKRSPLAFFLFLCLWLALISGGVYGFKTYTEQMQKTITADIERQTSAQIYQMQQTYDERITQVENQYMTEIAELKGKIDSLNELLTFTKDNTDSETDNSNKLYTQLNEVKKQLDALKKNLDLLK